MLNILRTRTAGSARAMAPVTAMRSLTLVNTIKQLGTLRSASTLNRGNEAGVTGSDSAKMAAGMARAIAMSASAESGDSYAPSTRDLESPREEISGSSSSSDGPSKQGAPGVEVAKLGSPRCPSCGTKFQSQIPDMPGYVSGALRLDRRHAQRKQIAYRNPKDIAYEKLMNSIPSAAKRVLEDLTPQDSITKSEVKYIEAVNDVNYVKKRTANERTEDIAKELMKKHDICQRCHEIKYQPLTEDTTLISNYARNEIILNSIPQDATMVHIMDGSDFPASLYKDIITREDQVKDIVWVINKADKLVNEKFKAQERVHDWAVAELSYHLNTDIDPNNVYIVSQKTKWHTKRLFHRLSKRNYFMGYTNSGKTSLILTLLNDYAAQDKRQRNVLASHARGISFVPGMTQETLKYNVGPIAIYDMPGFEEPQHGIHQWIKPALMAEVVAGRPWFKKLDFVNSTRMVIKPGHCLSVGGGALVEFPSDIIDADDQGGANNRVVLIAWTNIKDEETFNHVFTTKEKALDRIKNPLGASVTLHPPTTTADEESNTRPVLNKKRTVDRFFVKPATAAHYKLIETPVRVGAAGLEIAVLGLGTLRLKIHGHIPEQLQREKGGFKVNVWVPRDTKTVVRKHNLIERVFTRRENRRVVDYSSERRERSENYGNRDRNYNDSRGRNNRSDRNDYNNRSDRNDYNNRNDRHDYNDRNDHNRNDRNRNDRDHDDNRRKW